ncbi:MAG: DUF814 domain-containing protein [Desulfovibrionaceae bacterium]|nr:DUF814 domain-containing protein [Desulfovibrionaceae bacterium]
MESHVLRRVGLELAPQLIGARIETIYRPSASVYTFKISKPSLRPCLLIRFGADAVCLPALQKPDNPASPDAPTMRLRKYLCGLRISGIWLDWKANALWLGFYPRKPIAPHPPSRNSAEENLFLCLNMRLGPHIYSRLPENVEPLHTGSAVTWDIKAAISSLADYEEKQSSRRKDNLPLANIHSPKGQTDEAAQSDPQHGHEDKPWEKFPFLTPLLRETLIGFADPADALALLADLETAAGDIFVYARPSPSSVALHPLLPRISAWPLPPRISRGAMEQVYSSVLEALETEFTETFFNVIHREKVKEISSSLARDKKRILRALAKIDEEEKRLLLFSRLKETALLIQANLYDLDKNARLHTLKLADHSGKIHDVNLDPLKTITENMEHMFEKAAKAARGFPHLERRRAELQNALRTIEGENPDMRPPSLRAVAEKSGSTAERTGAVRAKTQFEKKKAGKNVAASDSEVACFQSPSGLLLLRGKNAKGNREVLKLASPYDIWLHAEGGPSAHLIIKLPHAACPVPQEDMEMAARLVAEKSWQRDDSRATIICALAKNVHAPKGAPHGAVKVEKILQTITVNLDNSA